MDTKICTKCKRELPATLDFFYKQKRGLFGLHSRCKECYREYDNSEKRKESKKLWVLRNIEKRREQVRLHKAKPKSKAKTRLQHVLKFYNLSEEELINKMDKQKGCCEICGDSLVKPDSKRFYTVDHNHITGEARGLLCNECNLAVGNLKEDINIVNSLKSYLEKYNG